MQHPDLPDCDVGNHQSTSTGMIDVCLLGNGGMMPLPGRPLSATLFRVGAQTVLFDCGEGTQVNWRSSDLAYRPTSTILLSHIHADHVAGLPGVLFQIAFSGRTEPLTIYGPEHTPEVVSSLLSIVGRLPFELRVGQLEGGETFALEAGIQVSTLALRHRTPCIGYTVDVPRSPRFNPERATELGVPLKHWKRLQAGESVDGVSPGDVSGPPRRGLKLALVTDPSYFDELIPFVSESDLLVCEAMFEDTDLERAHERGHMTFSQAATLARDAGVQQLWLTHFSPRVENPDSHLERVRAQFLQTEIGRRGLKTTLAFDDE